MCVSEYDLKERVRTLFVQYQDDWSKKNVEGMRSYTGDRFFDKQLAIFKESFEDSGAWDIVYAPEVESVTPLRAEKLSTSVTVRCQINARMVNFAIGSDGSVVSGTPDAREFTEYWDVSLDMSGSTKLLGISQVST